MMILVVEFSTMGVIIVASVIVVLVKRSSAPESTVQPIDKEDAPVAALPAPLRLNGVRGCLVVVNS